MKKLITLLLLSTVTSLVSCTPKTVEAPSKNNTISTNTTTQSQEYTPFTLSNETVAYSPFSYLGSLLIYPNWEENNKVSSTKTPTANTTLTSNSIDEQFDCYTSSIVLLRDTIYFADGRKQNALSSINLTTKLHTQLNSNSVHMLTNHNDTLYYINLADQKLYSFNTSTNTGGAISLDKVGKYIISGNFILYQNLNDNSKLYKIKLDGSDRQAITNYSVDSFAVYDKSLIVSNSSDNNYVYHIDPMTLESKRLLLVNATDLKSLNNKIYFLNGDSSYSLCELKIDFKNKNFSYSILLNDNISEYYLSPIGIFYRRTVDLNTPYFLSLTK